MKRGRSNKWGATRASVASALCLLISIQSWYSAELSEIVELVGSKGWRADLGRICTEFALAAPGSECIFKQISVQESEGRGDPRGFGPLVGEFFIVSPQGEPLKTFIRAKGRGYEQISNDEVRDEFLADLAYWKDNFARILAGLDSQSGRQR